MQRIIVENFGPIKHADIEITDIVVLIGEQASGKSTLAKLVYFFKEVKFAVNEILLQGDNPDTYKDDLQKKIEQQFVTFFPEIYYLKSHVRFSYGVDKEIIVNNGVLENTSFVNTIVSETSDIFKSRIEQDKTVRNSFNITRVFNKINELFADYRGMSVYIPAFRESTVAYGHLYRSFFYGGVREELIRNSSSNGNNDLLIIKSFIEYTSSLMDVFRNKDFSTFFTSDNSTKIAKHAFVTNNSENILKGEYINKNENEYIRLRNGELVELSRASSGQQSSVRILQDLIYQLASSIIHFRVIEEPEAHLFPTAQKQLMEAIAVVVNTTSEFESINRNQVFITTHSPYILAAFNNLLFAGQKNIENDKIDKMLWLQKEQVRAYKLENGVAINIIDEELGLIRNEEIDEASRIINEEFDFVNSL